MGFLLPRNNRTTRRVPSLRRSLALILCLAIAVSGCAARAAMRAAHAAESQQDFDRAVIEYTKALRANPDDRTARASLEQAKLRAAQDHFTRARRLASTGRFEEALVEYQLASELNPTSGDIQEEMRTVRAQLRAKVTVGEDGKTRLETLVEQSMNAPMPGQDIQSAVTMPDTLVFRDASTREILSAIAQFADISVAFDPQFRDQPITIDLRKRSLPDALTAVTMATRSFWKVTAPQTVVIVPDTPAKRREYEEEIVRTFFLSNADLKETQDILRLVIDTRRLSVVTAPNAISIKDTPERIVAAAKLISAIDKARPEVIIDVELLEVDRTRLTEYGLQIASPGSAGINGSLTVERDNLTVRDLRNLTSADVFLSPLPGLYYRLLKSESTTRVLANPQLRTSDGIAAQANFGERVPVPVTTFAPIAAGGVQTQPITSFNYENIGVNIDILPRTHHNDEVSLAVKIAVSSVSGTGFGGLPTFGNRAISTVIRLKDGETNMLAGLIRDDERRVTSGIPGLSDIPIIGQLFGHRLRDARETDIILTLTPRIVRVLDLKPADLQAFRVGRDSGAPLIDIPLPMPQPARPPGIEQPDGTTIVPPGQTVPPRSPLLPIPQPAQPIKPPVKPPPPPRDFN